MSHTSSEAGLTRGFKAHRGERCPATDKGNKTSAFFSFPAQNPLTGIAERLFFLIAFRRVYKLRCGRSKTSVWILTAVPQSFVLVFLLLVFLFLRVLFFGALFILLFVRVFVVVPAVNACFN